MSEEHENDDDDENEANTSRRDIPPLAAVRPPGHRSQERQDQNNDQDSSKHCFSPLAKSSDQPSGIVVGGSLALQRISALGQMMALDYCSR
jgi:hypothetical protein